MLSLNFSPPDCNWCSSPAGRVQRGKKRSLPGGREAGHRGCQVTRLYWPVRMTAVSVNGRQNESQFLNRTQISGAGERFVTNSSLLLGRRAAYHWQDSARSTRPRLAAAPLPRTSPATIAPSTWP